MKTQTFEINGALVAETGIVHRMIADAAKNNSSKEKNVLTARRMSQICMMEENGDKFPKCKNIPVVSGNAFRGILRRLLVEHSFDVLDISIEDVFKDVPRHDKVCHDVWFLFANGGLTPKGSKVEASSLSVYDKVMTIPWLGLLGGVYYGHQFEGSASFGILYPLLKENAYLYKEDLGIDDKFIEKLPGCDMLDKLDTARFTRRANPRDNSAGIKNAEGDDQKGSTDAMIYGSEYIPAGLQFVSLNKCVTNDPDIVKAFKAAIALFLETHRLIGGKSAMGFGRVHPSFGFDFDTKKAIKEYDDMLLARKEDLIATIRMIPESLKYSFEEKEEKKGKGKKKEAA